VKDYECGIVFVAVATSSNLENIEFDGVAANIVASRKSLPRIFQFFIETSTMSNNLWKFVKDCFGG